MRVEVTGVGAVRRGTRAVGMPELDLEGPGLVLVRGGNGSGKSTLVELLAGGIAPVAGAVRVCGVPAGSSAARRLRRVCRSEVSLLGHVTLRRHAALFAAAASVQRSAAIDALAAEALDERLDDPVDALSTGERRRAWVRLTTLGAAPVLLLDEPFLGLDAVAASALRSRMADWAATRLVLLVDHGSDGAGARVVDLGVPAEEATT